MLAEGFISADGSFMEMPILNGKSEQKVHILRHGHARSRNSKVTVLSKHNTSQYHTINQAEGVEVCEDILLNVCFPP